MNGVFDNLDHVIEQYFDENGNIHVRISQDVVVLTQEESNRVIARFDQLKSENARLRELVRALLTCATEGECDECRMNGATPWHVGNAQLCDGVWEHLRELGIEVDR